MKRNAMPVAKNLDFWGTQNATFVATYFVASILKRAFVCIVEKNLARNNVKKTWIFEDAERCKE